MACIPYAYQQSQDLFLYEDYVVTWSSGSKVVKRAIGWNPASPLYGYRKSLVGLCARHRTLSTYCGAFTEAIYDEFNDPTMLVNKPAFYNSFPPRFVTISRRFTLNCVHCFNAGNTNRDESKRWIGSGGFTDDTELSESLAFRWINHDNTVLQEIDGTQVILGFKQDPAFPSLNTIKDSAVANSDVELSETLVDMIAPPVVMADARSAGFNATAWMLDGSDKIIRCRLKKSLVISGHEQYALAGCRPDGTELSSPLIGQFLHDSGSVILIEVSPPTSAEAGDGVMGVIPSHVLFTGDFTLSTQLRSGYGQLTAQGSIAFSASDTNLSIREYVSFRGSPMPDMRMARIQDEAATEIVEQQIFDRVEDVSWA